MDQTIGQYLGKEAIHTGLAVVVTIVVAVAAELVGIQSFEEVSLSGLAVTAVRTAATAIVTLGSRWVIPAGLLAIWPLALAAGAGAGALML